MVAREVERVRERRETKRERETDGNESVRVFKHLDLIQR
jgi:hypothetical protein